MSPGRVDVGYIGRLFLPKNRRPCIDTLTCPKGTASPRNSKTASKRPKSPATLAATRPASGGKSLGPAADTATTPARPIPCICPTGPRLAGHTGSPAYARIWPCFYWSRRIWNRWESVRDCGYCSAQTWVCRVRPSDLFP